MAPKQDPKPKFQEGERVLCFHGPLLYEAKCVKVAIKDKQVKYFIHYSGWNKNWDEWVPESRVLKYVDTNLQKQKELQKANQFFRRDGAHTVCCLETPAISTRTSRNCQFEFLCQVPLCGYSVSIQCPLCVLCFHLAPDFWNLIILEGSTGLHAWSSMETSNTQSFLQFGSEAADLVLEMRAFNFLSLATSTVCSGGSELCLSLAQTDPAQSLKQSLEIVVHFPGNNLALGEETFMNRVEVKVKIPEELKPWLVDDWDLITRQKQLFYLPAKKNVDSILEDYANYKKSRGNTDNKEYAVNEVVAGIKEYFNVMLGTQLLYKFERPQYAEILADHPDAAMSQVYGAPHLLRLFVRIGAMLAYTPLDEKSLALLLNYLHDFLKYLAKNSSALFSASDYEVAPPEYHRKAV
ncbi:Mortality factor 4-like protein 1 [Willisornis vidua]|uniref:Mortality factor 4-like protein 1 n=1 Tax=Willisornis vidua TaxID=1566151 RepID=A0ABQ9CXC6_9PASS|nr:Mortality factor 4-like protein 1 [Willisornis vidua]